MVIWLLYIPLLIFLFLSIFSIIDLLFKEVPHLGVIVALVSKSVIKVVQLDVGVIFGLFRLQQQQGIFFMIVLGKENSIIRGQFPIAKGWLRPPAGGCRSKALKWGR